MALLLYKSNEMFSVTELIRKSKNIFDKIVNDEIEKAIILRDGKPGFLLMDFEKYEKIMADYEKLKSKSTKTIKQKNTQKHIEKELEKEFEKEVEPIKQKKPIEKEKAEVKEDLVVQPKLEAKKPIKQVIPPRPEPEAIKKEIKNEVVKKEELKKDTIPKELNEQEEIDEALDKIKNISLNDEERQRVESQIKERIKNARAEREKLAQELQKVEKDDLKEELELQVALKEKNQKKERELKEFWD